MKLMGVLDTLESSDSECPRMSPLACNLQVMHVLQGRNLVNCWTFCIQMCMLVQHRYRGHLVKRSAGYLQGQGHSHDSVPQLMAGPCLLKCLTIYSITWLCQRTIIRCCDLGKFGVAVFSVFSLHPWLWLLVQYLLNSSALVPWCMVATLGKGQWLLSSSSRSSRGNHGFSWVCWCQVATLGKGQGLLTVTVALAEFAGAGLPHLGRVSS